MGKTLLILDEIHDKFFADTKIHKSAYIRELIYTDIKFREWRDRYGRD